jgi:hypothetical protein
MSDWLNKLHGEARSAPVQSSRFNVQSSASAIIYAAAGKRLGTRVTRPSHFFTKRSHAHRALCRGLSNCHPLQDLRRFRGRKLRNEPNAWREVQCSRFNVMRILPNEPIPSLTPALYPPGGRGNRAWNAMKFTKRSRSIECGQKETGHAREQG